MISGENRLSMSAKEQFESIEYKIESKGV